MCSLILTGHFHLIAITAPETHDLEKTISS